MITVVKGVLLADTGESTLKSINGTRISDDTMFVVAEIIGTSVRSNFLDPMTQVLHITQVWLQTMINEIGEPLQERDMYMTRVTVHKDNTIRKPPTQVVVTFFMSVDTRSPTFVGV